MGAPGRRRHHHGAAPTSAGVHAAASGKGEHRTSCRVADLAVLAIGVFAESLRPVPPAAPLVIEIARGLERTRGKGGVQARLDQFFKILMTRDGSAPEHGFFHQQAPPLDWPRQDA